MGQDDWYTHTHATLLRYMCVHVQKTCSYRPFLGLGLNFRVNFTTKNLVLFKLHSNLLDRPRVVTTPPHECKKRVSPMIHHNRVGTSQERF